ncbi:MAG TPA: FxLYD domain-containing protein, partial [Aggregatilineales bacterium]|nr:FxLYD domain-containing protein [Aggregatilineales bacterium]
IPDELPDDNGIRMQFTAIEGAERVVRLNLMVVNTGQPMTAEAFIQAVNAYQPPEDVSRIPWHPASDPAAMADGSVRLTGVREYPALGSRAMNIFLQGSGGYFSALEVDVTSADPGTLRILMAVVNTFRVNANAALTTGEVVPPGVNSATGVIAFENYLHWQDTNGGFNITGQVMNNAEIPLEAVRLTAYLFDSDGNQLAERSDVLLYDVISSGEAAPFRLRFDTGRPSTAVRYELHAAARAAELSLLDFYGADKFLIGEDQAFYNNNGNLTITGLVQNNASGIAKSVKVLVTVFNEDGRVVAAESTFINKEELVPGEATPFEITVFDLGGNAFRYTLVAQGLSE